MPVWLRRFHIGKINEHNEKQNEEMEKAQGKSSTNTSNKPLSPNITPSSTYNY